MTDTDIRPSAFIKHQLPGRVRLKVPAKRGDFRYFNRMAEVFAECAGITQLQLNPFAASILVCHGADTPFNEIVSFAENKGLFGLTEKPADYDSVLIPNLPISTLTSFKIDQIDDSLLNLSQNRLNIRSILFLALIGLAIHQIARGNFMAPAATLLWYALELLEQETELNFEIENKPDTKT